MRNHRVWVALVVMMSWSCVAGAEEAPPVDPGTNGPWSFSLGLGGYWPSATDELKNQTGQVSLMIGGEYRFTKNFSLDVDLWGTEQRIDTPSTVVAPYLGNPDSRATISTAGVSVVAKFGWPMGPMDRVEPYVGAGGGVYYSTLNVTGNLLGTTATLDETDTSLGSVLLAGVHYQMWQNWALGAEFRRVSVKANFGSVIPGDVEVGGNSLMATLRWSPARGN